MPLVTNVKWKCPGCATDNIAQLYDDHYPNSDSEEPLSHLQLPYGVLLKWNPPCEKCKEYQLKDPVVLVDFPIVKLSYFEE